MVMRILEDKVRDAIKKWHWDEPSVSLEEKYTYGE